MQLLPSLAYEKMIYDSAADKHRSPISLLTKLLGSLFYCRCKRCCFKFSVLLHVLCLSLKVDYEITLQIIKIVLNISIISSLEGTWYKCKNE